MVISTGYKFISWTFSHLFFSASWPVVGLCPHHHLLQIELLRWRLRDALVYEYKAESLGIGLILCPYSRWIEVDFLLGPMTCIATVSWTMNGAMYGCHLTKWDLIPIRQLFPWGLSLLHLWGILEKAVTIVSYGLTTRYY